MQPVCEPCERARLCAARVIVCAHAHMWTQGAECAHSQVYTHVHTCVLGESGARGGQLLSVTMLDTKGQSLCGSEIRP